jgi:hypothetical protein
MSNATGARRSKIPIQVENPFRDDRAEPIPRNPRLDASPQIQQPQDDVHIQQEDNTSRRSKTDGVGTPDATSGQAADAGS